jgi:hypothetical protein
MAGGGREVYLYAIANEVGNALIAVVFVSWGYTGAGVYQQDLHRLLDHFAEFAR